MEPELVCEECCCVFDEDNGMVLVNGQVLCEQCLHDLAMAAAGESE